VNVHRGPLGRRERRRRRRRRRRRWRRRFNVSRVLVFNDPPVRPAKRQEGHWEQVLKPTDIRRACMTYLQGEHPYRRVDSVRRFNFGRVLVRNTPLALLSTSASRNAVGRCRLGMFCACSSSRFSPKGASWCSFAQQ
jgi:hypothetical protein